MLNGVHPAITSVGVPHFSSWVAASLNDGPTALAK